MPAELFDPALRPAPMGGRRRLTVTTSVAIHTAVLVLVVVLPLVGGVSMPSAMSRMSAFIAPAEPPAPPTPQPVAAQPSAVAVNPNAAPLHAPETIAPEVPLPVPGVPQVPGGLPVSTGYGVPGVRIGEGPTVLTQPPPAQRELVRAGGKVKFPARTSYVAPVYPPIAQSARVEGTVILEAIINEAGRVTDLRVLKSIPLLDAAAKEAVAQWRYSPTTLNGITVPIIMTVTVTFTLR